MGIPVLSAHELYLALGQLAVRKGGKSVGWKVVWGVFVILTGFFLTDWSTYSSIVSTNYSHTWTENPGALPPGPVPIMVPS